MRLLGQVLQEQSVHRPLEPDVQVRDVAFGERDDVDAGEGETLEETRGVFLVAAEAVERFSEHNVESAVQRIAHQRLETRTKERCAGDCVIGEFLDDRPALAGGELAADPELVRDRGVALIVRGVPARRSQPSLHCHLRPIFSLRHQLAREQLACGLPSERANERSKRFIATISRRIEACRRRARRLRCSRDRIITPRLLRG